jgi:hypothetical protein
MNFKNVTLPQAIIVVALLGSVLAANLLGGGAAAGAVAGVVSTLVAWFLRSPSGESPTGGQ